MALDCVKHGMTRFSQLLQNERRVHNTISNLNNILFKNKMLFNSLYWNTHILLSTVTTRGKT